MSLEFLLPSAQIIDEPLPGLPGIEVTVVRSSRRRHLAIHVCPMGRVEVRASLHARDQDIRDFFARHRLWVGRKLAEAAAHPPWVPAWREGGLWYWCGEQIELRRGGPRGGQLVDGALCLPMAKGAANTAVLSEAEAVADAAGWQRATLRWHRQAAEDLLYPRLAALFATHCAGHRLHAVQWRWMRATWGTCRAKRLAVGSRAVSIRLNPWLAALPPQLCDAVLLHELAHVEHMNHGAGFYRRLAYLDPDWRVHDAALKRWARLLFPVASQ